MFEAIKIAPVKTIIVRQVASGSAGCHMWDSLIRGAWDICGVLVLILIRFNQAACQQLIQAVEEKPLAHWCWLQCQPSFPPFLHLPPNWLPKSSPWIFAATTHSKLGVVWVWLVVETWSSNDNINIHMVQYHWCPNATKSRVKPAATSSKHKRTLTRPSTKLHRFFSVKGMIGRLVRTGSRLPLHRTPAAADDSVAALSL